MVHLYQLGNLFRIFDSGVRDMLFLDKNGRSFDLAALNIQRGRDHGIPSYTAWRKYLHLGRVNSFNTSDKHGLKDHSTGSGQFVTTSLQVCLQSTILFSICTHCYNFKRI